VTRFGRAILRIAALLTLMAGATPSRADEAAAWAALAAGGHVALIRHAETTPGVGDPPGWRLEDCATQRNLSPHGRAQAATLGAWFRERRIPVDRILTSAWCRCQDTAALMNVGAATVEPALANLFGNAPRAAAQSAALRQIVAGWPGPGTLVMHSHGSTILAFAGVSPAQAEIVVLAPQPGTPAGFRLVGRIVPP
jgi:phosphohistidine phosphatase SixA